MCDLKTHFFFCLIFISEQAEGLHGLSLKHGVTALIVTHLLQVLAQKSLKEVSVSCMPTIKLIQ